MHSLRATGIAELFEFYFAGYKLFVLACPIIKTLALRALELEEAVLGFSHNGQKILQNNDNCNHLSPFFKCA